MAVAQPLDFEIDFARNPISGSDVWFLVIILKFIFTSILKSEIMQKNSLAPKNLYRSEFESKDSAFV